MEPKLPESPPGPFARIAADVPWTVQCLTSQCLLGSVAADALCEWAAAPASKQHVCLIPSRFLGAGLHEGPVGFEDLAEVLPPHPLVSLSLPAGKIRRLLSSAQRVAWQSCAAPFASNGWQISSNARLAWSCTDSDTAELRWRGVTNHSAFEPLADATPVVVLTLAPALPLLLTEDTSARRQPGGNAEPHHFAVSAQHALADYLRAHSPLSAAQAVEAGAPAASRISLQRALPSGLPNSACAPSPCVARAPAVTRAAGALGVSAYRAAHVHAVSSEAALALLSTMLLLATLVALGVWLRRRRWPRLDALPASPLPPGAAGAGVVGGVAAAAAGATGSLADGLGSRAAPAVPSPVDVPPFGTSSTSPVSSPLLGRRDSNLALLRDPEREPLKTGGLRVVSHADLGA